jgi:hypothetical protein
VKSGPNKAPRNGAQEWNFTFDKGDLWIKARRPPKEETQMEMEAHALLLPAPTQDEAFDLIAKTLIEKVGDSCVAEGTYSIRPGRPAKLSWRIVSPTH